ncbi:hypothetical protein [Actinoplanes sp. G11-F43]|uniref:hypothetical protein n=1 Tax=Actinoplanes sp. G11-F43 TaxID=3424130 RepID=UPI003D327BDA
MSAADAVEELLVEALPDGDRWLLRCGAVLRYITRPLAELVTGSPAAARRLLDHPVVRGGAHGRADEQWTIAEPLRRALLTGWAEADDIRARVAERATGLEPLYARLAAAPTRPAALTDLAEAVDRALTGDDVPRAHDLLRLLDEWPVAADPAARELAERLSPGLRRHTRALRDREATSTYLRRGFDGPVEELLLADGDPWMLHLHGPGGRGKTMFVKNLLGRDCPARGIPVARIDFDHVTRLGVATTEPWRLLLSIAGQLDPQLPGTPFQYLLAKYRTVESVTAPEALPRAVAAVGGGTDQLDVDAADEVPEKFRGHLARAAGTGLVVIALDTVENVLHADSASLGSVLAALSDVRSEVPGLRLLITGRYDITGSRPVTGGSRERAPGVGPRWLGVGRKRQMGGTTVVVGREMATLEMPGFTVGEARRYLSEQGGVRDPEIIEAIVRRVHDNPMKLALLAEYVTGRPDVTAETIASFQRVDLFYLVDRVVDRIADGPVQWLLRWGALLPILSREAVEQVIWPALTAFAAGGRGYDDTSRDPLPPPPADVSRWPEPRPDQVTGPGALDRAWETLLDYTAHSSWVSRADTLPDAVVFHPDVRRPLRRLLHEAGHPAYDDIHHRSYRYWSYVASSSRGTTRSAALRAVLFHAYQPWRGADHDGDRLFGELLDRAADSRDARIAMAGEIVDLAGDRDVRGPSRTVRSRAHLELAEAAVHRSNRQRTAVNEAGLAYHLGEIGADVAAGEPGRVTFLRAALADAGGHPDQAWQLLGQALDDESSGTGLALIAAWAGQRTPPRSGLAVARRLAEDAPGASGVKALTRGLLAAELWTDAAAVVDRTGSAALRAQTLIALGRAGEVLTDHEAGGIWRARAHLLRYEPTAALRALQSDRTRNPARPLLMGQALALLDQQAEALDQLSQAAAGPDNTTAIEAGLVLARYLARVGNPQTARSHLLRLRTFADPVVSLRAAALESWLFAQVDPFSEARMIRARLETAPPSVDAELAVVRLALRGVSDQRLRWLASDLESIQGAGPRLLAARGLTDVGEPPWETVPREHLRLLELTALEPGAPAVLMLARIELARVIGAREQALEILAELLGYDDPDDAIARAAREAADRIHGTTPQPKPPVPEDGARMVSIRADSAGGLRIESPRSQATVAPEDIAGGPRLLLRSPGFPEPLAAALAAEGEHMDLLLHDAAAARWPWEAIAGEHRALIRRHSGTGTSEPVHVDQVDVDVVMRSELSGSLIASSYRAGTGIQVNHGYGLSISAGSLIHIVAVPVSRSGLPTLMSDQELVPAESVARLLTGADPRLLILDVALSQSDIDASEQMMVAGEFCWHLVASAPNVDVICGSFSDDPDRLTRLITHLRRGSTLSEIAADFQNGRLGWRNAVAVSTGHPRRAYRLDGSA